MEGLRRISDQIPSQNNQSAKLSGNISIDSLKCRIPFENVDILDPGIKSRWIKVNEETREVDPSIEWRNSTYREINGSGVKFQIEGIVINHIPHKYLTMTLPAKILGKEYFRGIDKKTVDTVYDLIQTEQIASFSKDSFLYNSACTDIDFKQDFIHEGNFIDDIQELYSMVNPSKKKGHGARMFKKKTNQGIEFSNRQTTSMIGNPYLKIYHKEIELSNASQDFASKFLTGVDYSNLVRVETTIKNKKHFRSLWGHDSTNLGVLVKMNQKNKAIPFERAIEKHLDPTKRVHKPQNLDQLKGKDRIVYGMIWKLMKADYNWIETRDELLKVFSNSSSRSQYKKYLNSIYDVYLGNQICEKNLVINFLNWSAAKRA